MMMTVAEMDGQATGGGAGLTELADDELTAFIDVIKRASRKDWAARGPPSAPSR